MSKGNVCKQTLGGTMYFIKLNDICVCLLSVTYNTVPFATLGGAPVQVLVYRFRPDIFQTRYFYHPPADFYHPTE